MGQPYDAQLAAKDAHCRTLLAAHAATLGTDEPRWLPPVSGPESGFRNKAKMVVAGTVDEPVLGILDHDGHGIDLTDCGLYPASLQATFAPLARILARARVAPYDVPARRGEAKYVIVTQSPDDELMVRFVLRSQEAVSRLRKHLPSLQAALPRLVAASVNVQPEHKAVLEGDLEIPLTDAETLPMRLGGVTLHLRPQSFFQTNTLVARALYEQAATWVDDASPASVWDLYCGVGGFALHVATPAGGSAGSGRTVHGVETSGEAVVAAARSAADAGLAATFEAGDATAFALASSPDDAPDLVVVNPPRRGIGAELAGWLERSRARHVVYSSCNVDSLVRDLAVMPSLRPAQARVLDMFPQTKHYEAITLLTRS